MGLSQNEITAADKMHEFVRAYERSHRRSVWLNFVTLPALLASAFREIGVGHGAFGYSMLGIALGFAFVLAIILPVQKRRYEQECIVLQILERDHGDQLPWVEPERQEAEALRHLAAVKEIEQGLAKKPATP